MNIDGAVKIWDIICLNPERWFQGDWGRKMKTVSGDACTSAFCFAGHAATVLGNASPIFSRDWNDTTFVKLSDGSHRDIMEYAVELLGINPWKADHLFDGDNSIQTIRDVLIEIAQEENDEDISDRLVLPGWAATHPYGFALENDNGWVMGVPEKEGL